MSHKKPKVSYENFCRAFAGVFKKHAYYNGTYHTCYIRAGILHYLDQSLEDRARIMEEYSREELVGYRIASQLLRCGWPEHAIVEFVTRQQEYVDAMDVTGYGFVGVLNAAGYYNDASFLRDSNGARYAWLMDGAPSLQHVIDALDAYNEDDEY